MAKELKPYFQTLVVAQAVLHTDNLAHEAGLKRAETFFGSHCTNGMPLEEIDQIYRDFLQDIYLRRIGISFDLRDVIPVTSDCFEDDEKILHKALNHIRAMSVNTSAYDARLDKHVPAQPTAENLKRCAQVREKRAQSWAESLDLEMAAIYMHSLKDGLNGIRYATQKRYTLEGYTFLLEREDALICSARYDAEILRQPHPELS